jgi:hypothetical protein
VVVGVGSGIWSLIKLGSIVFYCNTAHIIFSLYCRHLVDTSIFWVIE